MTAALNDCTAVIRGKSSPFKLRAVLLATTFIVPFFIPSGAAQAQVVIEGGTTENVPGTQASPWNIGNTLTVGDSGDGTLNIGVGGVPGVVTDTTFISASCLLRSAASPLLGRGQAGVPRRISTLALTVEAVWSCKTARRLRARRSAAH